MSSRATYREQLLAAMQLSGDEARAVKARIGRLYERCAADLARQLEGVSAETLRYRRDTVYIAALRERTAQLWKDVEQAAVSGMRSAAEGVADAYRGVYQDAIEALGLNVGNTFRSVFGSTPDEAVASVISGSIYAGPHASLSKRIWSNEALLNGQLEQVVAEGIAKGQSPAQLAAALEAYVNPKAAQPDLWNDVYPNIPFPARVDYNAKRLAVTAINHAGWACMVQTAKADPFVEFFHWQLSAFHHVQDICDIYAHEDMYGLGEGNHPLDQCPLPHPWCWCLYYADTSKSLEQIGTEIGGWMDETMPNERLDGLFAGWQRGGAAGEALATSQSGYMPAGGSGGALSPPTPIARQMVDDVLTRMSADFPSLPKWIQGVYMGDEPGIAAMTGDGRSILLDRTIFASAESAAAALARAVGMGHTGSATDPRMIIAHELGHSLHSQAALQSLGLSMMPTGDAMRAAYEAARAKVLIGAFDATELPGDEAAVLRQIAAELGDRAIQPVAEMIAQSAGIYYYGSGAHPIADRVMRYMMGLLTGR